MYNCFSSEHKNVRNPSPSSAQFSTRVHVFYASGDVSTRRLRLVDSTEISEVMTMYMYM